MIYLIQNRSIQRLEFVHVNHTDYSIYFGTMIFGCWYKHYFQQHNTTQVYFVMEDVIQYQGRIIQQLNFMEKLKMMHEFLIHIQYSKFQIRFPMIWEKTSPPLEKLTYRVHHIEQKVGEPTVFPTSGPERKLL